MERKTTKEWKHIDTLIQPYEPYIATYIGVVEVDPSKIVGISLWTPDEVYSDRKMDNLIEIIREEGWRIDHHPRDIDLMRLPDGTYTVVEGGNHRALLAREIDKKVIKASVRILIPEKEIRPEVFEFVAEKDRKHEMLLKQLRRVQANIDKKGFLPEDSIEWKEHSRITAAMDDLNEQEEEIYREEARRLGYL